MLVQVSSLCPSDTELSASYMFIFAERGNWEPVENPCDMKENNS